jgi:hypothetical protein
MSPVEYDIVRADRKEFRLPLYFMLDPTTQDRIAHITVDQLVSACTAQIMEHGKVFRRDDVVRVGPLAEHLP